MAIKLTRNESGKSIRTEMELAGGKFEIELLPCPEKEWWKQFLPFSKTKNIPNVLTKAMNMLEYFDTKDPGYEKLVEDLLDKHVINFWGIEVNGKLLDGSLRENKLLLGDFKIEDDEIIEYTDGEGKKGRFVQKRERYFRILIIEKIHDLARLKSEAETKNSVPSPGGMPEAGEKTD